MADGRTSRKRQASAAAKGARKRQASAPGGVEVARAEGRTSRKRQASAAAKGARKRQASAPDGVEAASAEGRAREKARSEPSARDSTAPAWFEAVFNGAMSAQYKRYMTDEWSHEKRGDVALFEKLCLEGAQAGLSWATILTKREGYRKSFFHFDLLRCAALSSSDIDKLVAAKEAVIVRHRGKCESVANNARCVLRIIEENKRSAGAKDAPPKHGYFDRYLWNFVNGKPRLNAWQSAKDIPSESETAVAMSADLRKRGFTFVGPKICYSLMQSCGMVIDHPKGTPEWEAARERLLSRSP